MNTRATVQPCGNPALDCRSCIDKFSKWQKRVRFIADTAIAGLKRDHDVFLGTVDVMEAAQIFEQDVTFYHWVGRVYQEAASLRVRRLFDSDPRTYSLRLLLEDIEANPAVMSRARYVHMFSKDAPWLAEFANDRFDEIAGVGNKEIEASTVRSDLEAVSRLAEKFITIAHKQFAHASRSGMDKEKIPRWGELDAVVSGLVTVGARYRHLLLAYPTDGFPIPVRQHWEDVFKKPWLRSDR
jgi:hypothetical protein